jgi:hypothetical protein
MILLNVEKHFHERSAETADPSAPLGMTKGRADPLWKIGRWTNGVSSEAALNGSTTLPFVIPSGAEGSAVSADLSWKCFSIAAAR